MGLKNQRSNFWRLLNKNDLTYIYYYNRLKELALSSFEWKNLPETIDERYLELILFDYGNAVFFEDDVLGYLALQSINKAPFDVYRVPINRRAYAVGGYNKELDNKNSVLIFNNMLKTNCVMDIEYFARKLYNADMTTDINIHAQKTPVIVQCDENQKLTLQNLYEQYSGNAPVIFANKDLDLRQVGVLQTNAPFIADKTYALKSDIWNEALTYLGISNVNTNKKERLITDEVQRNLGGTIASQYSRLQMRKKACEEINNMFGLNIDVEYRAGIGEDAESYNPVGEEEGDMNE